MGCVQNMEEPKGQKDLDKQKDTRMMLLHVSMESGADQVERDTEIDMVDLDEMSLSVTNRSVVWKKNSVKDEGKEDVP